MRSSLFDRRRKFIESLGNQPLFYPFFRSGIGICYDKKLNTPYILLLRIEFSLCLIERRERQLETLKETTDATEKRERH